MTTETTHTAVNNSRTILRGLVAFVVANLPADGSTLFGQWETAAWIEGRLGLSGPHRDTLAEQRIQTRDILADWLAEHPA